MVSDRKRIARFMRPLDFIPLSTTRGIPYQDGRFWVVQILCPDGHVRAFRSGPPSRRVVRRAMSMQARFDALTRDQYRCIYCGRGSGIVELQIDHLVPVAKGGTNDPDNLVAACRDCNAGKSDATLEIAQ